MYYELPNQPYRLLRQGAYEWFKSRSQKQRIQLEDTYLLMPQDAPSCSCSNTCNKSFAFNASTHFVVYVAAGN